MFIKRRAHRQRERGDTIVEVLIAVAVVSLVLGGAYVTTNRSLLATRAAEEQGAALKLAQGQLELVKGLAASDPSALFAAQTLSPFCVNSSDAIVVASDPECSSGSVGYHSSVVRTSNDFTLTETWQDVRGRGNDNVTLNYRVYQ